MEFNLLSPGAFFHEDTSEADGAAERDAVPESLFTCVVNGGGKGHVVKPDADRSDNREEKGNSKPEHGFTVRTTHKLGKNDSYNTVECKGA